MNLTFEKRYNHINKKWSKINRKDIVKLMNILNEVLEFLHIMDEPLNYLDKNYENNLIERHKYLYKTFRLFHMISNEAMKIDKNLLIYIDRYVISDEDSKWIDLNEKKRDSKSLTENQRKVLYDHSLFQLKVNLSKRYIEKQIKGTLKHGKYLL
jgi:hypothetical protein